MKHDNGVIEETLEPPFCSSAAVNEAARVVHATFGDDGMRYLQALVRYSGNAWPDIATHAAAITNVTSSPATHSAAAGE